jgi:epoxyqueuosine reductase
MPVSRVSFPDQALTSRAKGAKQVLEQGRAAAGRSVAPPMRGEPATDPAERVRLTARALGFDAVGIARADVPLDRDIARYDAFIANGMHGEMRYLARNRGLRERLDADGLLRGAKSVVCVARRYPRLPDVGPSGIVGSIARYARGRDYHGFLRRRIRRLAAYLRSFGSPDHPVRARPLCDDEPVLERAWAARAGLGFVGKNGMLIVPGLGSMVLLGEVVTTLDLPADVPMAERCGTCTRCLDACPTKAFAAPFVLDPRRCVAYLTIEHRSAIPADLAEGVGAHLFGCDDCQNCCPFNAGEAARARDSAADGDPFSPLDRWSSVRLADLLSLDEAGWRALAQGSPLKRSGRAGIARNAAIVLANRRDRSALGALRDAADRHDSDMVRQAAAWAVEQLAR